MAGILAGEVYWADLNPTRGHEQAGRRPVVVLSPETFNNDLGLAIAMAITSSPPRFDYPLTMEIRSLEMPKRSWALIGQVRALSMERFGSNIGRVSPVELDQLIEAFNRLLTEEID